MYSPHKYTHNSTPSKSTRIIRRYNFYSNALYIGNYKQNLRMGVGLTLYHTNFNQSSMPFFAAITSLNKYQQYHGHNIFYGNRRLVSVEYQRNRLVTLAYRVDGFLLFLRYNQKAQLDGECYLINYSTQQISKIFYENGRIIGKKDNQSIITNMKVQQLKQTVFTHQSLEVIIGIKHAKAVTHHLYSDYSGSSTKKPILGYEIPGIKMNRIGNKVQVYSVLQQINNISSNSKNDINNSKYTLGYSFFYRSPMQGGYNPETNTFDDDFDMQLAQKGIYSSLGNVFQLNDFGCKIYKNLNSYVGYFRDDIFSGEGVLRNPKKNSWVYGYFENGQMAEMLDYSDTGDEQKCLFYINKLIQKKNKDNFIPKVIDELDFNFVDKEIEKILAYTRDQIVSQDYQNFEEKKKNILSRITKAYLVEDDNHSQSHILATAKTTPIKKLTNTSAEQSSIKHKINYMATNLHNIADKQLIDSAIQPKDQFLKSNNPLNSEGSSPKSSRKITRISRIFNKTYQNLNSNNNYDDGSLIKLHRVSNQKSFNKSKSKRLRKSKIFISDYDGVEKNGKKNKILMDINASSLYKRRSPRKANIFPHISNEKSKDTILSRSPLNNSINQNLGPQKSPLIKSKSPIPKKQSKIQTKLFNYRFNETDTDNNDLEHLSHHHDKNEGSELLGNLTRKYGTRVFGSPTYLKGNKYE